MIKKIKWDEQPEDAAKEVQNLMDQLVDAVNELQESQNTYWTDIAEIKKELQTRAENVLKDTESRPENVQDKFAKQRKWIGKLCWFWDTNKKERVCGILEEIKDNQYDYGGELCPYINDYGESFKHCEPVKPDEPIIYKGE